MRVAKKNYYYNAVYAAPDCVTIPKACFRRYVNQTLKDIFEESARIDVDDTTTADNLKKLKDIMPRWTESAFSNFQLFVEHMLGKVVGVATILATSCR